MTDNPAPLAVLLDRIRNGYQDAAWQLVEEYGRHIYRLVRRQLSTEMRSYCDSDDFVQAVWGSFFTDSHKLNEIDDPSRMLAVLAAISRNKVIDEVRRRQAAKRAGNLRPETINELDREHAAAVRSHEPSPSQVAIAKERWDQLMQGATSREQRVLQMRFEGRSYEQIAEDLQISERTVIRTMKLLEQRVTCHNSHTIPR